MKSIIFTNGHLFPHSALCQQWAVQDVLMQNDIVPRLSPSEAYCRVMVQDVTGKHLGFLTLEQPLIKWIHWARLKRQRYWYQKQSVTGQRQLVIGGFGQCLTGQNRTKTGPGRMMTEETAFLGFSPSDILVNRTRVAALSLCPISQRTFVQLFFQLKIFLQVCNDFQNFFHHIFLNFFL